MKSWIAIAGVVGFASAMIAMLYFQPKLFDNVSAKEPHVTVTIDGLKDAYSAGEPIDFFVRLDGYGCESGFPDVVIYKEPSKEPVWSRSGEIRSFPAGYSCPYEEIHQVRHMGDVQRYNSDEQERIRTQGGVPIVITEKGRYVVDAASVTKEFVVS